MPYHFDPHITDFFNILNIFHIFNIIIISHIASHHQTKSSPHCVLYTLYSILHYTTLYLFYTVLYLCLVLKINLDKMENCPVCLENKTLMALHESKNIPHKICHQCAEKLEKKEKKPASSVEWIGAQSGPAMVSCPLSKGNGAVCANARPQP